MREAKVSPSIAYHLRELEAAHDPAARAYCMPEFLPADRAILDVGCGIGQTFVGAGLGQDRLLIGLDLDTECLEFGRARFPHIQFVHGAAERLPFPDQSFDMVVSRVTLPMTDIPRSLSEIGRVLKSGGRAWLTVHSFSKAKKEMKDAVRRRSVKDVLFRCYVIANGLWFHFFGRLFHCPFKTSRIESFQTRRSMQRCMREAGFTDVRVEHGRHFLCTASKKGSAAAESLPASVSLSEPEYGNAPIPHRYHDLSLVVGVDQPDEVAEDDAVSVAQPRARQHDRSESRISEMDRHAARDQLRRAGRECERSVDAGAQVEPCGA
jgi:ubiquinone/menaquinone biosynthesis C-methylase UbiE